VNGKFFGVVSELTDIKDIISFFLEVGFQFGVGCIGKKALDYNF
jgi:hypothetical protein